MSDPIIIEYVCKYFDELSVDNKAILLKIITNPLYEKNGKFNIDHINYLQDTHGYKERDDIRKKLESTILPWTEERHNERFSKLFNEREKIRDDYNFLVDTYMVFYTIKSKKVKLDKKDFYDILVENCIIEWIKTDVELVNTGVELPVKKENSKTGEQLFNELGGRRKTKRRKSKRTKRRKSKRTRKSRK